MSTDGQGREILFHHPFPLLSEPKTGSQIRPRRMLDAFKELNYEVVEVTGYGPERIPIMKSLAKDIRAGRQFEFCYSESVTSPTALSDPHHLPRHPLADPVFFKELRKAGIPIGLYYRDVHWRFDQYRDSVPLPKQLAAKTFYYFDLAWYARLVDVVFLPDLGMADSIPGKKRFNFRPLPPGTVIAPDIASASTPSDDQTLRLIYIGSVSPPHNDISPLLRAIKDTPGAHLTLTCPSDEAAVIKDYPSELTDDVEVLHLTSNEVAGLYASADVTCLVYKDHPYRDFAMPVKLFESIGYLTPCITNADSAAGRFVESQGIGWTFTDDDDLRKQLHRLVAQPEERIATQDHLRKIAPSHTWLARAETVSSTLS